MSASQTDITLRHAGVELVRITLPPGQYTIGRSREAQIFVNTPLLSRRHARLTIDDRHLLIEDLGSSNGTFINDQPVSGVTRLQQSQSVRLGDVQLEIRRRESGERHAAPAKPHPAAPPAKPYPAAPPAPHPVTRPPAHPPPRTAPGKSKAGLYVKVGAGLAALAVVAFDFWPKGEKLTKAELYAKAHQNGSPSTVGAPTSTEVPTAAKVTALMGELRSALVAAKVQGLKDDAVTPSRSGKLSVNLENSNITDLAVLRGYPVDELQINGTKVTHLEPLRELPLVALRFNSTSVAEARPLAAIPTLEEVILGKSVTDLEMLRTSSCIKRISYDSVRQDNRAIPRQSAAEFWQTYDQQKELRAPAAAALRKMGVKDVTEQKLSINKAGKFEINLSNEPISDLAPLTGLAITRLDLGATKVSNLAPLRGLALQYLNLRACPVSDLGPLHGQPITELIIGVKDWKKPEEGKTKVSDLSPLRGMPLRRIIIDGALDPDVTPLADIPSLQVVTLSPKARNIDVLRKLANLKGISWGWPGSDDKITTAAVFWKEYDAKNGAPSQVAVAKPDAAAPPPEVPGTPVEAPDADAKILAVAKQKRLDLFAKFQFAEARTAIKEAALTTESAREEQEVLVKKAAWLANFKSQLIEDLNASGYAQPVTRKSGEKVAGGVARADDSQLTLRASRSPLPWADLSPDSIYAMGSSFIQPSMAPQITAFHKWHLGVFAFYAGKTKEGLDLLHEAAQLHPVFKDELPLFEKATGPY